MNRRDMLRLVLTGGALALGVACAAPAPSAAPPAGTPARPNPAPATPAPAATTTQRQIPAAAASESQNGATPRPGGTLRLGTLGDLVSLDGHASGPFDTLYQVWDLLGVEDEHLNLQPVLAESFDWSTDTRQLKFNLRKGVTWHTGRDFTSDDVRWNLERVRDPKVGGGILASYVKPLVEIETPDKWTIVLKSNDPWPGVYDFIQHLNIIDPVTAQGPDGPNKPVGTGPFMVGRIRPGRPPPPREKPRLLASGSALSRRDRLHVLQRPTVNGCAVRGRRSGRRPVTHLARYAALPAGSE